MGVSSGGQGGGGRAPWIFKYGTNIVDRGLKVLFFSFFVFEFSFLIFFGLFRCLPPRKRLNSAIFRYFLLMFGLFFRWPPSSWKIFCRRPYLETCLISRQSRDIIFQSLVPRLGLGTFKSRSRLELLLKVSV